MKTILTVVGARPQFIKAAVVSRAIVETAGVNEVLVHTGQHYDTNMSDVFFEELNIPQPHHYLGVGGGTHGQNTGRMLEKLEALMQEVKPDWVLVYGDTDSTLAGALAASKLHIPVAHVEAGLRSYNRKMPEEINRILTDHLSTILFAPTLTAVKNLNHEGINGEKVKEVGDVMLDAALFYKDKARKPNNLGENNRLLNQFVLCTIHRAENTDSYDRLNGIFKGLAGINQNVILPIHPRTKSKLMKIGLTIPENVRVIDPVSYLEMVWLEMNCIMIITDSGGVQKEAYFHSKPCLTMRNETEWTELVELGAIELIGVEPERMFKGYTKSIERIYSKKNGIYGNGDAGKLIANYLSTRAE